MAFTASLPTWNREVEVYRTANDVAGAEFRGTIVGQIYTAAKRRIGDCLHCQVMLLYPYEEPLILHPTDMLPEADGHGQHDVVVFPWDASCFEDGKFYGRVEATAVRYDSFPNQHNLAILHMETLLTKTLWFPASPNGWSGENAVADGSCGDCETVEAELAELIPHPSVSDTWTSEPFSWTCHGGEDWEWLLGYHPETSVYTLALIGTLSGAIVSYTASVVGWDGVSPLSFGLDFATGDECDWPDPVVLTPSYA